MMASISKRLGGEGQTPFSPKFFVVRKSQLTLEKIARIIRIVTPQFLLAHADSPDPGSFRGRSLGNISTEKKREHDHRGTAEMEIWIKTVESELRRFLRAQESQISVDKQKVFC